MIAIDTNVLVRMFVDDDFNKEQAERAKKMLDHQRIYITKTVLLETEWVLRYAYGFDKNSTVAAFEKLCGLDNVNFEDRQAIETSIVWHKTGIDFADALHLASSNLAKQFITFDKNFVKRGSKVSKVEVVIL